MEFIELSTNLLKLPDFLKWYILSFHANPQTKSLTEDIKNYVVSRNLIRNIYHERWHEFEEIYPETEDWLDNDLIMHINVKPIMRGYEDKLYEVMTRSYICQQNINKYIKTILKSKKSKTVNNIVWGLLTVEEREEFTQQEINNNSRLDN
jgi:hypothetical protein